MKEKRWHKLNTVSNVLIIVAAAIAAIYYILKALI